VEPARTRRQSRSDIGRRRHRVGCRGMLHPTPDGVLVLWWSHRVARLDCMRGSRVASLGSTECVGSARTFGSGTGVQPRRYRAQTSPRRTGLLRPEGGVTGG
jgi:hypothetical protein